MKRGDASRARALDQGQVSDAEAALRLLEAHRESGEPITIASTRHGLLKVDVFELRGDKITVCGTSDAGDEYCTDHIPVRVFIEWEKKHKGGEPIVEPGDAVLPGSSDGGTSPEGATAAEGPKDQDTERKATKRFKVKVGAADISEEIEARARDVAEEKMNREKESLRGFTGWLKKVFVHNYGREIYRQHEIRKAREAILREGNLYAADGEARAEHDRATAAVVDRILEDYDEFIHEEAGEKREKLGDQGAEKAVKDRLTQLVKDFAGDPAMPMDVFAERKQRILHDATKAKSLGTEGKMFADNVEEVALRIREHAAHAGGIENLDLDLDFTIARAKLGARTERETNMVDRAIEKLNKWTGGGVSAVFGNEIAYAVATVYAAGTLVAQRAAGSALAAWGTFGASAGVAGVIAGLKEKERMRRDRVLHERQRAVAMEFDNGSEEEREARRQELEAKIAGAKWHQWLDKRAWRAELDDLNRTPPKDKTPRRVEMEGFLREKAPADELARSLLAMLEDRDGVVGLREATPEAYRAAAELLAEAEARVRVSDHRKIDLLAYSDVTRVEEERRNLDYARALLKSRLREAYAANAVEGKDFNAFYAELLNVRRSGFESSVDEKDRLFNKLARKKAIWTGAAVAGGAMVVGGVAHEIASAFSGKTYGIVDLIRDKITGGRGPGLSEKLTPLGKLTEYITGAMPELNAATLHTDKIGVGEFVLPDGVRLEQLTDGSSRLVYGPDNTVLVDKLRVLGGAFDQPSVAKIEALGIGVDTTWTSVVDTRVVTHNLTVPEWIREHGSDVVHARRDVWYGNDTPMVYVNELKKWLGADWNELKLWWGADQQIGINANGDYVMDMSRMTSWGSWTKGGALDVNPHSALAQGKLRLLLSLNETSQNHPVELTVQPDGTIVIPKGSDVAKAFFEERGGKAVFLGRFAEIAEMRGLDPDGSVHYGILATHEGKGVDGVIPSVIEEQTSRDVPVTTFDFPATRPVDVPPLPIPTSWRTPLEPMKRRPEGTLPPPPLPPLPPGGGDRRRRRSSNTEAYGYGYGETGEGRNAFGLIERSAYAERVSSKLKENKEFDTALHEGALIEEYLNRQDKEYLRELEELVAGAPIMKPSVELSITVPAYSEEKNIEKTIRYYATLKNPERFELVILENHPADKKRDKTGEVIERMRAEFPQLNIVHLYKAFANKPAIGNVRKFLVDSVLLRRQMAGIDHSIAIASNDADLEGISPNYANDIAEAFRSDHELDAVAGRWDFPRETYKKYPLLHATQRLWHYFDIALRNYYLNSPELIGRNSAFRAGTYAAIGGYGETSQLAEDLEIGWMIKEARGYDADRIRYINKAKLVSNPRRAVVKLMSGGRLVQQYGDFHVNEEVRKAPLEQLIKERRDFKPDEFGTEVQSIYDHYIRMAQSKGGWIPDDLLQKSFRKAMGMLGVAFTLENDKVAVTDLGKLTSGLESYAKEEE